MLHRSVVARTACPHSLRSCLAVSGIGSLFNKAGCDRQQIDHLLHSQEGVTEDNMLRYLGIVEERINELLTAQATILAKVLRLNAEAMLVDIDASVDLGAEHAFARARPESDR